MWRELVALKGLTIRGLVCRVINAENLKLPIVQLFFFPHSLWDGTVREPPPMPPIHAAVHEQQCQASQEDKHAVQWGSHHCRTHVIIIPRFTASKEHLTHLHDSMSF